MLTPCRSKVAFVLALDPLQKQGLSHSLFFDSLQKQSHNYLNLLMLTPCRSKVTFVFVAWSPAEARSWPFFIFQLLVEAKSQPFKFVDMLTPCRSKVAFVLGVWSPTEARFWPFFIFWLHARAKSQPLFIFRSSAEARALHFFSAHDDTRTKSVSLSLLNFYFDNMKFFSNFHIIM